MLDALDEAGGYFTGYCASRPSPFRPSAGARTAMAPSFMVPRRIIILCGELPSPPRNRTTSEGMGAVSGTLVFL